MKPLQYIVLAAVMACGLAGSFLLIPSEADLSLMYFRGHQYEEARRLYEKRLGAGDRSVDVVMPLSELYVQSGDVDRAVVLLRQLAAPAADRLDLFQRVATFQKYGEQMQEYLQTLEAINRIKSSEDGLRDLAAQYRYANENAKLIPALQTLVARYQGEPAEYLELANLLAVGGRTADAAGLLDRFEARHPRDVTPDSVEFLVSVLIDSGQGARALDRAARWLGGHAESGSVARFAALLRIKGQTGLAARLLAPFEPAIDGDPVLLAEWLQLQVAGGRTGEAFERLDRLRRRNLLSGDLTEPFLDLALARGEVLLAIDVAGQRGFRRLNDGLLGMLAERALEAGQEAFVYRMAAALGGGFLENRPLLAARLAYARGDRAEAARHLQTAEARRNSSDSDRLAVASLDTKLGRRLEAAAQLARMQIESAPESILLETARLYVEVGRAGEGADRFDGLRTRKPTAAVSRAWALAAAGAGRGREVARWVDAAPARSIPEPLLHDLYFLAQDHKQADLALAASRRLFQEQASDANRLMLVNALTAAGLPLDALPHARALVAHSRLHGVEEAYTGALLSAIRGSPGGAKTTIQEELRGFWTAKLGQPGQDEQQRLNLVYGLLELGAWDAALPHLETLARRRGDLAPLYIETAVRAGHRKDVVAFLEYDLARGDLSQETREARVYALLENGGQAEALPYIRQIAAAGLPNWIAAYEDVLHKLDRPTELLDFWRNRLASGALSPDERRGIGFKLVEAGRPELARPVFADLARSAAPDHGDVAELLFLWGPKPDPDALDWLEDRARHATGAERTAWLGRLLDAGAPNRVAAIAAAHLPVAGLGGELLEVYVRALAELHDVDALAGAVAAEVGATADRDRVRKLAGLVRDVGGMAAAEPAYARLLALDPTDREALHWLAVAAYSHARYSVAEHHLSALLTSSEGGYDDNFYYAEMLWRSGARSQARAYYGRALRLIERMASPPPEARTAHAQALFRSGSLERAIREYRTLVAAAPRNGDLRADFGAMLLEARLYDEAGDVLSGGVDSGGTRMALLRVQLLSATARRSGALELIESLSEANPDSASVVAALGLTEQSVGRSRRAKGLFERAVRMDPENEDLQEARANLDEERAGQFRTGFESRRIQGTQSENLVRILAESPLSQAFRLQFAIEQDRASIRSVRYTDGHVGPFEGAPRRGEAALEWESNGGTRVKGILLAGNSATGGGLLVTSPDSNGVTAVQLDFNQAYWDYTESLAQGGVRDRVELRRETTLSPRVSVRMAAAANRYSLPDAPRAAESAVASGAINVRLARQPLIAFEYSFDGEYRLSARTSTGPDGIGFQPLPLVSREVHTAGVQI